MNPSFPFANTKISWRGLVGLILGCVGLAAGPAQATTITDVHVTIGPTLFAIWSFPIVLHPGQDLVLTQRDAADPWAYNFDTSDEKGQAVITITADGLTTTFLDLLGVLTLKGLDAENTSANEAQKYGAPMAGPSYDLFLGYVDTVHTGLCGAYASSLGLNGSPNCLPGDAPFAHATAFEGAGSYLPFELGLIEDQPWHCKLDDCYDAGVLRIVARDPMVPTPESTSIALLGIGLLGVAWRLRSVTARAR